MDFQPTDLLEYTIYWIDEFDTRLFRFNNDELFIRDLKQQLEEESGFSMQEASALTSQLRTKESRHQLERLMIAAFEVAWNKLTTSEQALLYAFHRSNLTKTEAIADLSEELNCSESTVRRHYKKALHKFQKLFVG